MKLCIEFVWEGTLIRATGDYEPGLPAQIYGPPENCYPEEPAYFEFETCEVEDKPDVWLDARWILATSLYSTWHDLACDAAEARLEEDHFARGEADYEEWSANMDERDWK